MGQKMKKNSIQKASGSRSRIRRPGIRQKLLRALTAVLDASSSVIRIQAQFIPYFRCDISWISRQNHISAAGASVKFCVWFSPDCWYYYTRMVISATSGKVDQTSVTVKTRNSKPISVGHIDGRRQLAVARLVIALDTYDTSSSMILVSSFQFPYPFSV